MWVGFGGATDARHYLHNYRIYMAGRLDMEISVTRRLVGYMKYTIFQDGPIKAGNGCSRQCFLHGTRAQRGGG